MLDQELMKNHLMIAVVAAAVNYLLSMVLPPLLKNTKLPYAEEIKQNYECNKDIMLVSSLLTIVFVFIALQITPWVSTQFYSNLAKLSNNSRFNVNM
jgi:hypothetical protein